ncbi:unnamed protein product [Notodromas monacha]|uniref:Uncharacterized protein n=1 Tax=Notodromas monacha TaxID=399045 RepID=A0A7R9C4E7_9CRUS|nr:unnamed protein product [Notodromas monacha]CAG0926312.1 unnamed protein product [Notodromas monacha]
MGHASSRCVHVCESHRLDHHHYCRNVRALPGSLRTLQLREYRNGH